MPKTTAEATQRSPEPRRRRLEERRQQILSAAVICFEDNGYHETSIADIARTAGVSAGLIYQYFSDKKDVLFQVINEILDAYMREIPRAIVGEKDPLLRFQLSTIAYFKVVAKRVSSTLLAYRETKILDRDQIKVLMAKEVQTNHLIQDCIEECIAAGYFADDRPDLTTYSIINAAHIWSLKNWRLQRIATFDDYVRHSLGLALKSLLTEEGRRHLKTADLLDGRPL